VNLISYLSNHQSKKVRDEIIYKGSGGKKSENLQFRAFAISFKCLRLYLALPLGLSTEAIKLLVT